MRSVIVVIGPGQIGQASCSNAQSPGMNQELGSKRGPHADKPNAEALKYAYELGPG